MRRRAEGHARALRAIARRVRDSDSALGSQRHRLREVRLPEIGNGLTRYSIGGTAGFSK